MSTLLFSHSAFAAHEVPPGHPERGARARAVEKALGGEDFEALLRRDAPLADADALALVHSGRYCDRIAEIAPAENFAQIDADTYMGPTTLEAAMRAAGAAVAAVDAIYAGEAANAFVAARPPGHHALPDRPMGFCFFNSAAVAALHARTVHGAKRVAVVDFDVHHGNGTEAAFWHNGSAFFGSSHESPQYPGTGRASDRGEFGNIVNAPLPTGSAGDLFRRVWGERILPALSDFGPDFIVISAGFDAHRADPVGGLLLVEDDFIWVTREIVSAAKSVCGGRIVSVLEGGYDLEALSASTAAHVKALMEA